MPANGTPRRHIRLIPKCPRCDAIDPPEGFRANGYCNPCGRQYEADRRAAKPTERKAIRHRSYLREIGIDVPPERPGPKARPIEDRICPQCQQSFTPLHHADPVIYCSVKCKGFAARTTLCPRCKLRDIEVSGLCRDCDSERQRGYRAKLRAEVMQAYGGQCVCCGESHDEFLALDHCNNDGAKHRIELGGAGNSTYRWAKQNNYPETLQILCHNCNLSMAIKGYCPHGTLPKRLVLPRGNPKLPR